MNRTYFVPMFYVLHTTEGWLMADNTLKDCEYEDLEEDYNDRGLAPMKYEIEADALATLRVLYTIRNIRGEVFAVGEN